MLVKNSFVRLNPTMISKSALNRIKPADLHLSMILKGKKWIGNQTDKNSLQKFPNQQSQNQNSIFHHLNNSISAHMSSNQKIRQQTHKETWQLTHAELVKNKIILDQEGNAQMQTKIQKINFVWLSGTVKILEFTLKQMIKYDEFKFLAMESTILQAIKMEQTYPLWFKLLKIKNHGMLNLFVKQYRAVLKSVEDFFWDFCICMNDVYSLIKYYCPFKFKFFSSERDDE